MKKLAANMNSNSQDEGVMPGAEIEDKSPDGINANAGDGDDDFFESLRLRQTTIEEEEQAEELNESIVDSTPAMMVLDTHANDEIPDLTSNISPTSISTASTEEKYIDEEISTFDKAEKEIPLEVKPRTASDLTTTAVSPTRLTKCGLFIVLGLLSSASWFACNEITTGFKVSTFTKSKQNLDLSLDIFQNFQDARKRPHFYEQQNELYSLDATLYQKPQESASEVHATDHLQQQLEMDTAQERGPKRTMGGGVLRTGNRRSKKMHVDKYFQKGKMDLSSSSSDTSMSKILPSTIVQKVQRTSEQVTNTLATLAGDLAEYLNSVAKSAKFRMQQNVNNIAQHLNNIMKTLASKNAEIQAGSHSMVGGRESLMHVGTAAKNVAQHLNEMTKHLASTNAEIQANNIQMVGVRESFTKIGTTVRKRTSRIVTRKLKIDAIYF